ncbi:hypothetical protein D3C78_665760 [compost metagenome]
MLERKYLQLCIFLFPVSCVAQYSCKNAGIYHPTFGLKPKVLENPAHLQDF